MDQYERRLVRGLFTAATEIIENAHTFAVKGQSQRRSAVEYVRLGQQLNALAADIHSLSEAAITAARRSIPATPRKSSRR